MDSTPKCYIRADGLLPWRAWYFYLDREPWLADGIFIRHHLKVHFGSQFERDDTDAIVVTAWVYPWQAKAFEECMSELYRASVIRDGRNYTDACRAFMGMLADRSESGVPSSAVTLRAR